MVPIRPSEPDVSVSLALAALAGHRSNAPHCSGPGSEGLCLAADLGNQRSEKKEKKKEETHKKEKRKNNTYWGWTKSGTTK